MLRRAVRKSKLNFAWKNRNDSAKDPLGKHLDFAVKVFAGDPLCWCVEGVEHHLF